MALPSLISSALTGVLGVAALAVTAANVGAWGYAFSLQGTLADTEAAVQHELQATRASLDTALTAAREAVAAPPSADTLYIVVSISDRTLQLRQGAEILKDTKAAIGMGTAVIDGQVWKFETPRGIFKVEAKEDAPVWNAPGWHYVEYASKRKLKMVNLDPSTPVTLSDGSILEVQGTTVGKRDAAGAFTPLPGGREVVADGQVFVPPPGTVQRQYAGVLGTRRLKMRDGYAIHGTDKPWSVGRAASHGCIRLTNADIEEIYPKVPVGTPIIIY